MRGAIAAIPGICVDEGDNDSTDAVFGSGTDTDDEAGLTESEEEGDSTVENSGSGKFVRWGHTKPDGTCCLKINGEYCPVLKFVRWGHMKPDGTCCLKTNGEYCPDPGTSGAIGAMPPFWQRHISDEHGAIYFWNSKTRESRWARPTA